MDARRLAQGKFRRHKSMSYDAEGVEMATPAAVAAYRAGRLACDTVVDLCCGIGGDTIALARACGRVVAVDKDPARVDMARRNCEIHGLDNVEFVAGDALEYDLAQTRADYAFSDPSRRVGSRRVTRLQDTFPQTDRLVEKMSSLPGFCIEASPRLAPDDVTWDCEREYVSLDGETNCMSLYFGKLKRCDRSAVVLDADRWEEGKVPPSSARLEMRGGTLAPQESGLLHYFHEVEASVEAARLEPELAASLGFSRFGEWLTSETAPASPFLKATYEVLERFDAPSGLASALRRHDAGKVVLRGRIDPGEQLRLKAALEKNLSGDLKLHAFVDLGVVARCTAIRQAPKGQPL